MKCSCLRATWQPREPLLANLTVGDQSGHPGAFRRVCMIIKNINFWIERFHMTSRPPYWCSKPMKRWPCWCFRPVLWVFCFNKFSYLLAKWVKGSIFHLYTLDTVDLGRGDVILPMIKLFFTKNKQHETMVNFNFVQPRKRHVENCYIILTVCQPNFSSQFITYSS